MKRILLVCALLVGTFATTEAAWQWFTTDAIDWSTMPPTWPDGSVVYTCELRAGGTYCQVTDDGIIIPIDQDYTDDPIENKGTVGEEVSTEEVFTFQPEDEYASDNLGHHYHDPDVVAEFRERQWQNRYSSSSQSVSGEGEQDPPLEEDEVADEGPSDDEGPFIDLSIQWDWSGWCSTLGLQSMGICQ